MIDLKISRKIFNDVYLPYLTNYSPRYEVYYGGAGSGKSHFVAQKLIIKLLQQKRTALVIRKVGRTVRDSVFKLIRDMLKQFRISELCKINISTFEITFPNGSVILFKGLDDNEKVKSITDISDIWIEEATELNNEDFLQLDLRLRGKAGSLQIWLSFNPVSKVNWVYKHFFENGTPKDTRILRSTYKDNRFLPPEYIAALEEMKEHNAAYYKIYALGEFASLDKLIFPVWTEGLPPDEKAGLRLLCGLDFGYINDNSAFVASWLDETNKVLYINDEHCKRGMLNDEIADAIKYKGYAKEVIVADSAEEKSIEEIRRAGISRIASAVKGKGSILQGIQKLQQYRIIVNPLCVNTIIELQNYAWQKDKKTGEYINVPIDDYNHCIDALRYSLQCAEKDRKIKTINKAALGL